MFSFYFIFFDDIRRLFFLVQDNISVLHEMVINFDNFMRKEVQ